MFRLVACFLSLVVCDVGLRVIALVSPHVQYLLSRPWSRNVVPDAVLGWRMSPYYPGHDSRGYRNERALEQADVLAVGDSLTYGFAAPPAGSWPRQLATLSDRSIYNSGVGGYGPCEYHSVLQELLTAIRPRLVVLGLYLGNDIANAYSTVYVAHRFLGHQTKDPAVLAAMKAADALESTAEIQRRLDPVAQASDASGSRLEVSALYDLLRSARYNLDEQMERPFRAGLDDSFAAAAMRPGRVTFDAVPKFRTVFRPPELDAVAVNLEDPRTREGWRITQDVLRSMRNSLAEQGVGFLVLVIHNKPYEYAELAKTHQPSIGAPFFRLVDLECALTAEVIMFLQDSGIDYVDTGAAVHARFTRGTPPYKQSDDHHPNSDGYGAIAEAALPWLKK